MEALSQMFPQHSSELLEVTLLSVNNDFDAAVEALLSVEEEPTDAPVPARPRRTRPRVQNDHFLGPKPPSRQREEQFPPLPSRARRVEEAAADAYETSEEVARMGDAIQHAESARQALLQRYDEVPPGLICDVFEQSGGDVDKAVAMLWDMMPEAMENASSRMKREEDELCNVLDARELARKLFRSGRGEGDVPVERARTGTQKFEEAREIPGAPDWSPDAQLRRERMLREAEDLREQAMNGINGGKSHMPRYLGDAALRIARARNPHMSNYISRRTGSGLHIHPCLPMPLEDGDTLEVDVHGLRKAEAVSLVVSLLEQATTTRGIGGKKWRCIGINTGRGIHSRNGVSVLRPAIEKVVQQLGLEAESEDDNFGRVAVRL